LDHPDLTPAPTTAETIAAAERTLATRCPGDFVEANPLALENRIPVPSGLCHLFHLEMNQAQRMSADRHQTTIAIARCELVADGCRSRVTIGVCPHAVHSDSHLLLAWRLPAHANVDRPRVELRGLSLGRRFVMISVVDSKEKRPGVTVNAIEWLPKNGVRISREKTASLLNGNHDAHR